MLLKTGSLLCKNPIIQIWERPVPEGWKKFKLWVSFDVSNVQTAGRSCQGQKSVIMFGKRKRWILQQWIAYQAWIPNHNKPDRNWQKIAIRKFVKVLIKRLLNNCLGRHREQEGPPRPRRMRYCYSWDSIFLLHIAKFKEAHFKCLFEIFCQSHS